MTARKQSTKDYYAILGVDITASDAEIKKAYRRLARQYHPDRNNGDPAAAARFREITEAYEALTGQARRNGTGRSATGTAATGIDVQVISRILGVLEETWQAIRRHHTQVPPVVVIIASGTDGKQARWGHHAPGRWHVSGEQRTEIMISGEGLRRSPREVLGTLLHEAAHALAAARGIKDTSRQGRYHNAHFAELARELGIHVEKDSKAGWSITTVPDHTAAAYAAQLEKLQVVMTLWRRDEILIPKERRNTNLIAAVCLCARTIRVAASTLAEAPIICTACGGKFEPRDS
jgi:hypothetical protein